MSEINYPELGAPGEGPLTYRPGDRQRHPSGYLYELQPDGRTWRPVESHDGRPIPSEAGAP